MGNSIQAEQTHYDQKRADAFAQFMQAHLGDAQCEVCVANETSHQSHELFIT